MTEQPTTRPANDRRRNAAVAVSCAAVFFGMVGLAFASAPLYRLFCQVTGFGGTTQVAASAEGVEVLDRPITVRFDANVGAGLPWRFTPEQRSVTLKLGELGTVYYVAENISDRPTVGSATFNVTPDAMGPYFSKIACFCFTEQKLEPGETLRMGVSFYVDPAMVDDADSASIKTVTLSYTFYPATKPERPVASAAQRAGAAPQNL